MLDLESGDYQIERVDGKVRDGGSSRTCEGMTESRKNRAIDRRG
jgi:hypothetical protein